ncbi:ATPase associated with various cellular activities AAA_5 (plasmid) [Crinalium epipsammum PCC 9333]|uniref:ATPase associated with various cellular activities AAA_5 n=1 Tax=Crinalium epipsammum PCC 9333 TaxID=1173022 RepID=K9W5T1_9CYAN|nr:MoxR family ATPase [Crinalium epipsammum]AFZ15531.1 ATPase associated with various cellular activities AAA_5 [Crinalium epipsammum PCC 9333]
MSRRYVDTSSSYSLLDYQELEESREIEYIEVDTVVANKRKKKLIYKEPYLPDNKLVEAVNLAIALGRPLLLQGEPGCGKTRLAYAVAYALGLPLEESYIKSTSRAQDLLYIYDAVNRLYDAQLGINTARTEDNKSRSQKIQNYIRLGSLGRAIARAQNGQRSVVLIDEIDKADLDFPNDLLWELDRLEFKVTEDPEIHYRVDKPELRPIVFVTHNEEKALPTAFLRRCIFHYVEFPQTENLLQQLLATHEIADQNLSNKAIKVLLELRKLDLSKRPGLSELLDWVSYLEAVRAPIEELNKLPHLGALLKQDSDHKRAVEAFAQL